MVVAVVVVPVAVAVADEITPATATARTTFTATTFCGYRGITVRPLLLRFLVAAGKLPRVRRAKQHVPFNIRARGSRRSVQSVVAGPLGQRVEVGG